MKEKIGIIGAGITGLSLGYFLKDTDHEFVIFEKNDRVGGELMNTEIIEGFTYNTGGEHLLWSKYDDVLDIFIELMGRENLFKRERNAKVLYKGKIIKYPFETGISELDPEMRYRFLKDFVETKLKDHTKPKNVVEWFYQYFGKSITEEHMLPVNRTWWNIDPNKLSMKLVERIPKPTVDEMVKSGVGIDVTGLKEQANFYYPKRGGSQFIADSLSKPSKDNILLNHEVKNLKKNNGEWEVEYTEKGNFPHKKMKFDRVVSTIPLTVLPKILDVGFDSEIKISNLKVNSLYTVLVALDREVNNNISWLNFGDFMTRISFPKNYSPYNTPKNKGMITAEITYRDEKPKDVEEKVVDMISDNGIIDKDDVIFTKKHNNKFAYIVPDIYYYKQINRLRYLIKKKGLDLVGRFGNFEYINIDKCMLRAKEFVEGLR